MPRPRHARRVLRKIMVYEVRKEDVARAIEAVRAFVDEVNRKEGGTASYRVYHHVEPATRFTHVMEFRTPAAEKYHQGTAWAKKFAAAIQPMCVAAPASTDVELVEK